jgi:hypothetical protein
LTHAAFFNAFPPATPLRLFNTVLSGNLHITCHLRQNSSKTRNSHLLLRQNSQKLHLHKHQWIKNLPQTSAMKSTPFFLVTYI